MIFLPCPAAISLTTIWGCIVSEGARANNTHMSHLELYTVHWLYCTHRCQSTIRASVGDHSRTQQHAPIFRDFTVTWNIFVNIIKVMLEWHYTLRKYCVKVTRQLSAFILTKVNLTSDKNSCTQDWRCYCHLQNLSNVQKSSFTSDVCLCWGVRNDRFHLVFMIACLLLTDPQHFSIYIWKQNEIFTKHFSLVGCGWC